MLALDFIKANRETVERAIRDKGVELDIEHLLQLDDEVRALKMEAEQFRYARNQTSRRFPKAQTPEQKAMIAEQAREFGDKAAQAEAKLTPKEAELKALMLKLPGI